MFAVLRENLVSFEVGLDIGAQRAAGARVEAACEVFSDQWNTFAAEAEAASAGVVNSGMPLFAEAMMTWGHALGELYGSLMSYSASLSTVDSNVEATEAATQEKFALIAERLGGL